MGHVIDTRWEWVPPADMDSIRQATAPLSRCRRGALEVRLSAPAQLEDPGRVVVAAHPVTDQEASQDFQAAQQAPVQSGLSSDEVVAHCQH